MTVCFRFNAFRQDQVFTDVIPMFEHLVILTRGGSLKCPGTWIFMRHVGHETWVFQGYQEPLSFPVPVATVWGSGRPVYGRSLRPSRRQSLSCDSGSAFPADCSVASAVDGMFDEIIDIGSDLDIFRNPADFKNTSHFFFCEDIG